MNGAVCRDVISGYYCDCPAGYAGALCDHVNSECTVNTGCGVNEVCTANQCVCERDRIRGENDICIGVTEVKEYSMTLTVSEVDGQPAVYDPSLMGAEGEEFRQGIEYEIRQIIGNDASLSVALVDVVTRNIFSGSIVVEMALIFRENSSNNSSNINLASVVAATTTDENILRESGTAFTIVWNASAVQDANECEDSAGNDCSPYAQCMNTDGSYECTCLPGYENTGPSGVPPGRNCTDINECSPDPCLNGATCSDGVNGYTCTCADGYSGDDCGTDINECSPDPCLNAATCTDSVNGYTCICVDGFSGDDCGTDINECSSDPCLNGATCSDRVNGYTCTCADGYSGDDCGTDINECSSDPCLNGADCSDGVNGYICICADGYSGDDCGTDINECYPNPCLNNAVCTDSVNGYICICVDGYSGDDCGTDINECSSDPCLNGADCSDGVNGYICICADGYSGDDCGTDINECYPNPCLNNAVCTDSVNGYICICVDGYSGDDCGTDINECSSDPCLNGAACTDSYNGYTCTCADGYSGDDCGTDINECSSDPCLNSAACSDGLNGYTCTCADGYSGDDCGTDINGCSSDPCLNGAGCSDGVNGYICICVDGFSGDDCGTDINECSSDPCLNGAACSDEVNGYTCTCVDGYIGDNCGTDINECSSDPCLNGAACTDEVNGYSCICVDGYSGDDCRTDINECSSDPCLNGAACSDGVNGYTCTCADGYSGDDCGTDEDECIASPCQNGGACSSLANRFLCECSAGYSGDRCQIEPVTCVSGNSCGELKVCNTEEMCECGPDYVENASGQCEVAYSFEVSLTITSLNGGSISFTIALTDVTSSEYIRLAFILRRLLLLQVRILRRLARIIFTSGSVIATFEIGTDEPMSPNDLQQMILSDLGNGNITSGGSSIGVDPDSLVATDVNECLTASDNDCSHNADCVNVEGSYNCTCREGYADRSPDARRPGRVCTGGLSTGTIIALSVGLGVVFLLFIILTCTACVFMQSRANLINKEHYARSPYNVRGHPTHRTRDGGRAFKTDVDRDFAHLYGKYAAPRPIPPFALYGDGTRNWYLSDGRGHMDSPFGSRGPDYHMSPPRGSVARPSHRGSQRPHGYSASPVDRLQPSLNDFEDTLPPYSRRYDPNFEEDDEFHRPYYVSGEAIY
ncbi:fibropellin-1-like [Strongylocentrotus purpuratus]|uniref:Uncharacterized protein n=1 Tax=Strongylocentrotus purpuratus TaxID=7668 RepID=A0A7M7PS72_STRPU|nr:fibropellin-1-like [Strongylocentrotus purpuratus]